MQEEFVTYELAVKLKELGFDEECLNIFFKREKRISFNIGYYLNKNSDFTEDSNYISAPLWQQTFDWFRDQYRLHTEIRSYTAERFTFVIQELKNTVKYIEYGGINNIFKTYEEAREACLEKLIELCQK
jgi:hypothetical protein